MNCSCAKISTTYFEKILQKCSENKNFVVICRSVADVENLLKEVLLTWALDGGE
jgi:hypothetical protein